MKKYSILGICLLMINIAFSQQKEFDTFEVQVDGLGCPFCAYGLEKKFKEFKGIKKVAIEIETGNFSFVYPTDKNLALTDVTAQVKKAGYTPITAKVTRADGTVESTESTISEPVSPKGEQLTETFTVAGKCAMCKARIESTSKNIPGVQTAVWNMDTQQLTVSYNKGTTSVASISEGIALSGHDTEAHKASDSAYANLPACCHFKRLVQ